MQITDKRSEKIDDSINFFEARRFLLLKKINKQTKKKQRREVMYDDEERNSPKSQNKHKTSEGERMYFEE